ncbi:hypothetical protein HMPREF3185_01047 [Porphyromonas somerae]|uniref:Uncharacterized protein n=1 Tax=Porphyromonas somerae TaxID=322095 RepID=A0A134B8G7_9PORP|nr:hypothetical protein HMPREF3184_01047 [Porphyromonadaceae bacterium KA00676]KXB76239.1 hypothetical protein HMPREF3185_01047 [Porphyromonas somerae]
MRFGLYLVFALSLQPQTRNEPPQRRADPSEGSRGREGETLATTI